MSHPENLETQRGKRVRLRRARKLVSVKTAVSPYQMPSTCHFVSRHILSFVCANHHAKYWGFRDNRKICVLEELMVHGGRKTHTQTLTKQWDSEVIRRSARHYGNTKERHLEPSGFPGKVLVSYVHTLHYFMVNWLTSSVSSLFFTPFPLGIRPFCHSNFCFPSRIFLSTHPNAQVLLSLNMSTSFIYELFPYLTALMSPEKVKKKCPRTAPSPVVEMMPRPQRFPRHST